MTKHTHTAATQADMFAATCEDTPLFSGVAATHTDTAYTPQPVVKQPSMPGFERDWIETKKQLSKKGKGK